MREVRGPLDAAEVGVHLRDGLVAAAREEVPVAVERDGHARVRHVGAGLLDVQARRDHEGRRRIPRLVQAGRGEARLLPRRASPAAHRRGIEGVFRGHAEQQSWSVRPVRSFWAASSFQSGE